MPITITTNIYGILVNFVVSLETYSRIEKACEQENIHPQTLCKKIIQPLIQVHKSPKESDAIAYLDKYFPQQ